MKIKLFLSVACLSIILSIPASAQSPETRMKAARKHLKTFKWDKAISQYKKLVKEHPRSPQAAKARIDIGLAHKSHKRYDKAIGEYKEVVNTFHGTRYDHDAKTGIAAVNILQNRYQDALALFEEVLEETSDWDQIKYCSHWIRRLKAYIAMSKEPVACAPYSLHTVLAFHNIPSSLEEIAELTESNKGKVSLATLARASKEKGLEAYGLRLSLKELREIEKPVIVLTNKDHYQVVTKIGTSKVILIDQDRGRYSLSSEAFKAVWKGYTLAFGKEDIVNFKSARLSSRKMDKIVGGVCYCLPPGDTGMPGPNTEPDNPDCDITVNTANGNTTVTGPTITSSHSLGPSVIFKSYYNSDDSYDGPLGHSWTHNYNAHLTVKPNGDVHLKREGGKVDIFTINTDGSYTAPKGIYDILTKHSDGSYTLEKKDKTIQNLDPQGRLVSIADKSGNQVILSYDEDDLLTQITDASGRITTFSYNSNNRIESITDPVGRTTNYLYDDRGRLISVTNPLGETTTYTYDGASYLISMTTPKGTVNISYGREHAITGITNSLNKQRQYFLYHYYYLPGSDITTKITDENGNKTIYRSDYKKTLSVADPLGHTTSYEYDESENRIAIVDARGNRTSYTYDVNGNLTGKTGPTGTTTYYTYDSHNNQTSVTDPKGNTTDYPYDENDNLTSIQDPLGNITSYTYDNNGLMTSMRDPKGNATYYEYDAFGNLIKVSEPQGRITSYTYDGVDNRTSMTDPNGNTTYYTYDPLNRLIQITNPDNTTIQYQYDCCNLIRKTDEKGNSTNYEYDAMNRLTKVTDAKGNITQYTYDNVGNRLSMTEAKGNTTSYTYDKANHLTKVTYPDETYEVYMYDKIGNRAVKRDSNNHLISYIYDANNRLIIDGDEKINLQALHNEDNSRLSCTTAEGYCYNIFDDNEDTYIASGYGAWRWWKFDLGSEYQIDKLRILVYGTGGPAAHKYWILSSLDDSDYTERVPGTTPGDKSWAEYSFEDSFTARYIKMDVYAGYYAAYVGYVKIYELEVHVGSHSIKTYAYDENGNRTSMTDDSGITNYTYDELNRLIQVDGPKENDTISYTYDKNGNLTGKTGPTGTTTYYTYDSLNRLIQVTSAEGRVTSYEYDLVGNRTRTTLPNGVDIYHSYDERNRLLTLGGGAVDISYTYDAVGNRITKEDGFYRDSYTYDPLNQLTKEEKVVLAKRMPPGIKELPKGFEKGKRKGWKGEETPPGWEKGKKKGWPEAPVGESITTAYTYDPVGNRLSMDRNGVVTSYSYDVANKLLAAGDTTFSYDLNGNLTDKTDSTGTTNYAYDYANRLTNAGGVSFAYDGDGNRISKGSAYFVNDVNLPLAQVLLEQDEAGTTLASYTYGLELISMAKGGVTYYYIYDGLGNVVAITDEAGQTVQTYDYDAFGNVISTSGALDNPYQFVGGYGCADDGVGLIYMRARYYAPSIGRFITRDPIWGNAHYPLSLNRYLYVSNNPVNAIDPKGLGLYNPECARRLRREADKKVAESGLPGAWNGPADAYRHCWWGCETAKQCGRFTAFAAGWGHEFFPQGLHGGWGWNPSESPMDVNNNWHGRKSAKDKCDKNKTCDEACRNKVNKGDLTTLTPANAGTGPY